MAILLGQNIKNIRQNKKIGQLELATRLKYLNQSQVSKIEKGDRKITAQDLIEIAKALDVTVDEIVNYHKSA